MNILSNLEINIFALAILALIYLRMHGKSEKRYDQRLFLFFLLTNSLILILDCFMWILDGTSGQTMRITLQIFSVLYLSLNAVPGVGWALYVKYEACRQRENKRLYLLLLFPVAVNLILSIASTYTGWYFYLDGQNHYQRGPFFPLFAVIGFSFIFLTQIYIVKNHKKFRRKHFLPIFFFAIPPILGGVIQSFYYGVSLVWAGMTLSILLIFINIQDSQLFTDPLTGLQNRRHLDYLLQDKFLTMHRNSLLGGMMIDINNFKAINDQFGHDAGDLALANAGQILSRCFRRDDLICRYGGDEFVVLMEISTRLDLEEAAERLHEMTEKFMEQNQPFYHFSFSIGYDTLGRGTEINAKEFIRHLDELMYRDKRERKRHSKY